MNTNDYAGLNPETAESELRKRLDGVFLSGTHLPTEPDREEFDDWLDWVAHDLWKAGVRSLPGLFPGDLDAAWAEAEAAMPEGWVVSGVWLSGHGDGMYQAQAQGPKRSQQVSGDSNKRTPAAALRSLAAKLREKRA